MPHKRNPIGSENMTGMARVIRGYMVTAYENVPLWHERDISHSSAERIILPDATIALNYMLNRFANIVKHLLVYPVKHEKNYGAHVRAHLFTASLACLDRQGDDARGGVRFRCSRKRWKRGRDKCRFRLLLEADERIMSRLTKEELDDWF